MRGQNSGPPWTQTLILGVLDMPDCIYLTWYSRLGVYPLLQKVDLTRPPPYLNWIRRSDHAASDEAVDDELVRAQAVGVGSGEVVAEARTCNHLTATARV